MKFFDGECGLSVCTEGKYNWVDENNVFVGFDSEGCCCEDYGYFYLDENQKNIPNLTDEELAEYRFDVSAGVMSYDGNIPNCFHANNVAEFKYGGVARFKITNGKKDLYIVIYNSHNGFYSHGYEYIQINESGNNTVIESGML